MFNGSILSKFITMSLVVSFAMPTYAVQPNPVTVESLEKLIAVKEKELSKYEKVIDEANSRGVGMESNNYVAVASAAVVMTVGVPTVGAALRYIDFQNKSSEAAYMGAVELNEKIYEIVSKADGFRSVNYGSGPESIVFQEEYNKLSPNAQKQIFELLKEYGSKYSKEDVDGMYKALKSKALNSSYEPIAYVAGANESHWQIALRRARLRIAKRYAVVVGVVATLAATAVVSVKAISSHKWHKTGDAKLNELIDKNDQVAINNYIAFNLNQISILSVEIAALQKQLDRLLSTAN